MTASFHEAIGLDAAAFPLVAERLAVDATSALRAGDAGLRGLRGRPLLRRVWDAASGGGADRAVAVGQDLLAVQRATLGILREVMKEELRTQHCLERVLLDLHAIHDDLDELAARADGDARRVDQGLDRLRADAAALRAELAGLRRELGREAAVRRLTELYRARALHPGLGEALESALFLAAVATQWWGVEPARREEEWRAAVAVVRQRRPPHPCALADALLAAVGGAAPELDEATLYLADGRGPFLSVVRALAARRRAGLAIAEVDAADAVAVARATADPDGRLDSRLVRPAELACALARELLPQEGAP